MSVTVWSEKLYVNVSLWCIITIQNIIFHTFNTLIKIQESLKWLWIKDIGEITTKIHFCLTFSKTHSWYYTNTSLYRYFEEHFLHFFSSSNPFKARPVYNSQPIVSVQQHFSAGPHLNKKRLFNHEVKRGKSGVFPVQQDTEWFLFLTEAKDKAHIFTSVSDANLKFWLYLQIFHLTNFLSTHTLHVMFENDYKNDGQRFDIFNMQ